MVIHDSVAVDKSSTASPAVPPPSSFVDDVKGFVNEARGQSEPTAIEAFLEMPVDPQPAPPPDLIPESNGISIPSLHNREAEEAVVGAALINSDAYFDVSEFLSASDFYIHRLGWVWDACGSLTDKKFPIDLLTVSQELEAQGRLDEAGGRPFLTALVNQVPTSLNAVAYGRIVEGFSIRRKLLNQANTLATIAYSVGTPIDKSLNDWDKVIENGRSQTSPKVRTFLTSLDASKQLLDMVSAGAPTGEKTSLPAVDYAIGALPRGEVTTVVGDSSIGKTAMFLQIAEQRSFAKSRSLIFQYESSELMMVARRVLPEAGVEAKDLRAGVVDKAQRTRIEEEIKKYRMRHQLGHLFFDTSARTLTAMRRSIREVQPSLVVVDNLSEMESETKTQNWTIELLQRMNGLKAIAHDFNVAMVVIHNVTAEESEAMWPSANGVQPNKNAARVTNEPPNINGIAWAKDLKNKTDILLFLVPDVSADLSAPIVPLKLWVMKDRAGERLQIVNLWFDRKKQWMTDKQP